MNLESSQLSPSQPQPLKTKLQNPNSGLHTRFPIPEYSTTSTWLFTYEHRSLFKIPSLPSISFQSLGSAHPSCIPLTCIHFFPPTLPLLWSPSWKWHDMSLISQGPLLLSLLQQTVFFKNDPISAVVQIRFPEPSHSPLRGMVCFSLLKFG